MTYTSEVLADSPLGFWHLNETTGTTSFDTSGGSHNLTWNALPGSVSAPSGIGNALNLSGSQTATPASSAFLDALTGTTTASFEIWVKLDSGHTGYENWMRRCSPTLGQFGFRLHNNSPEVFIVTSGGTFVAEGGNDLADATFHHIVAVYDGSTLKLYTDNRQVDSVAATGTIVSTTEALWISRNSTSSDTEHVTGGLAQAAVFPSALSTARISAHYRAGLGSYAQAVLADAPTTYLRCDETAGARASDSSGNGNDGGYNNTFTLSQAPLFVGSTHSVLLGSGDADSVGVVHGSWMDTAAFSVEAWVKLTSSVTGDHNIASRDSGGTRGWQLYVENGNIVIYIEAAGNRFAGSSTIALNTVYHVVLTYDGSSAVKVYLNGAVEISLTGKTVDNTSGGWDLYWGTSHAGGPFFNFPLIGYVDELAFYPAALSTARVQAHYNAAVGPSLLSAGATSVSVSYTIHATTGATSHGATTVHADSTHSLTSAGRTTVTAAAFIFGHVYTSSGTALGGTAVTVHAAVDGALIDAATVITSTAVSVSAGGQLVASATSSGTTTCYVSSYGGLQAFPDVVAGSTNVFVAYFPESESDVQVIAVAVDLRASTVLTPPEPDPYGYRAIQGTVISMPQPAIAGGKPYLPLYWAQFPSAGTFIEGGGHIYAVPAPVFHPPKLPMPPTGGNSLFAQWTVDDLPDPASFNDGWYWLGDPTGYDGTAGIAANCRQWSPSSNSSGGMPSWRSAYPFKPSVVSADHWLWGGGAVHHPKAVNFNSHFIEHMWMNFPTNHHQPFTWVIAAMVGSYPSANYHHYLLDSGTAPYSSGVPQYSAEDCNDPRIVTDGVGYRTMLRIDPDRFVMRTHDAGPESGPAAPHNTRLMPRMYVGVFDGANSYVGVYGPDHKYRIKGTVNNGSGYQHRFYLMGRRRSHLDQTQASHLLVFEARWWSQALDSTALSKQYGHLSTLYQFEKYREVN